MEHNDHKDLFDQEDWGSFFEGQEMTPPDLVWEKIESKLDEKKKRRVVPFWWYGIASALLIFFGFVVNAFIGNWFNGGVLNENNTTLIHDNVKEKVVESDVEDVNVESNESIEQSESEVTTRDLASNDFKKQINPISLNENDVEKSDAENVVTDKKKEVKTINSFDLVKKDQNEMSTNSFLDFKEKKIAQEELTGIVAETNNGQLNLLSREFVAENTEMPIVEAKLMRKAPVFMPNKKVGEHKEFDEGFFLALGGGAGQGDLKMNSSQQLNMAALEKKYNTIESGGLLSAYNSEETIKSTAVYNFSGGYQLSDKWIIKTGLEYSRFNSSADQTFFHQSSSRKNVSGEVNVSAVVTSSESINNTFSILAVPVIMEYKLFGKKLSFWLNGGLSTDIFIAQTVESNYGVQKNRNPEDSNVNPYFFSGIFGANIKYRVAKKYLFMLSSDYKKGMTQLHNGNGTSSGSSTPEALGVKLGIQINL
ncbi:hypothetical protein [Aureibacter tunicatorum]|uniref:Outer membrane protein beta-barrel domain-containing protein n=1 Tax=Aureibacter tunicatorum TaxID=866807 RepID=A0AAE3XQA7_9BACT|nr:hypothetical protein [Aureibacter tunicatorum]MDR6239404.1 hypothetical protein [Aureibacter tunicatorum]BDD04673.1 hypothetical protein AUTU_21560 [Aureibacter tunicatorum]